MGFTPAEQLRAVVHQIRAATDAPFNINFITCFDNDAQIRVCAEEKVPVASFHWGSSVAPEHLTLLRDAGVSVWEQVGGVEAAKKAVGDGVEVIVAQGWEAGGHNYGGLPTMVLVPEILDAVAPALVLACWRHRRRTGRRRGARSRCRRRLGRDAAGCNAGGGGPLRTQAAPCRGQGRADGALVDLRPRMATFQSDAAPAQPGSRDDQRDRRLRRGNPVTDLATLRLAWEPRMLSILRIMVGLLYMEHGLAKVVGFHSSRTMRPTPPSP